MDNPDWRNILQGLSISGMVRQLAENCVLQKISDNTVNLLLSAGFRQLQNVKAEKRLQQALSEYFDADIKLEITVGTIGSSASDTVPMDKIETPAQTMAREIDERQRRAEAAIEEDSFVQAMKKNFNAEVIPGSVKPVSDQAIEDKPVNNGEQMTTNIENEVIR